MDLSLSSKAKKHLRGLGQTLEPVFHVGKKGLEPSVVQAFDACLRTHPLAKVSWHAVPADRQALDALCQALAEQTAALYLSRVGKAALFYRPNPEAEDLLAGT
jgi:RNA-binding protein